MARWVVVGRKQKEKEENTRLEGTMTEGGCRVFFWGGGYMLQQLQCYKYTWYVTVTNL